ncbi:MAG: hypothetical protein J5592_06210 [Clostridia bacterium]|nr:hypothetical protein [Clostridia bacterium]
MKAAGVGGLSFCGMFGHRRSLIALTRLMPLLRGTEGVLERPIIIHCLLFFVKIQKEGNDSGEIVTSRKKLDTASIVRYNTFLNRMAAPGVPADEKIRAFAGKAEKM